MNRESTIPELIRDVRAHDKEARAEEVPGPDAADRVRFMFDAASRLADACERLESEAVARLVAAHTERDTARAEVERLRAALDGMLGATDGPRVDLRGVMLARQHALAILAEVPR